MRDGECRAAEREEECEARRGPSQGWGKRVVDLLGTKARTTPSFVLKYGAAAASIPPPRRAWPSWAAAFAPWLRAQLRLGQRRFLRPTGRGVGMTPGWTRLRRPARLVGSGIATSSPAAAK